MLGVAAIRGGQDFEQMLKGFVLARRVLPSSRRAATQLARVMGELASDKAIKALGDIGIQVTDTVGNIRNLSDIMLDLARAAEVGPLQARDALNAAFGQAAVKPMLAMLAQLRNGMQNATGETIKGAQVYEFMNKALRNSTGAMKAAKDAYMETTEAGVQQMTEAWETFRARLGEAFLPALKALTTTLAGALTVVVDFIKGLGPFGKTVLKWGTVLIFAGGAITALKMAFGGMSTIWGAAAAKLKEMSTAQAASNTATATNTTLTTTNNTVKKKSYFATLQAASAGKRLSLQYKGMNAHVVMLTRSEKANLFMMNKVPRVYRAATVATNTLKWATKSLWAVLKSNPIGWLLLALPKLMEYMDKLKKATSMDKEEWQVEMKKRLRETLKGNKTLAYIRSIKDKGIRDDLMKDKNIKRVLAHSGAEYTPGAEKQVKGVREYLFGVSAERITEWPKMRHGVIKEILEEQLKQVGREEELRNKMSALREKMHMDNMQKSKNALMLGSAPFERAVTKLEGLMKYKPKIIKTSSIAKVMDYMDLIQKRGPGGRIGAGPELGAGDVTASIKGKAGMQELVSLLKKATSGGKVTGTEAANAAAGAMYAINLLKHTMPGKMKMIEKLQETTVEALLHQLKPAARASAAAWLQSAEGQSAVPDGGRMPGFFRGAGGFAPSGAAAARKIGAQSKHVSPLLGGRRGQAGAGLSAGGAAELGAGSALPDLYGSTAEGGQRDPKTGRMLTSAEITGMGTGGKSKNEKEYNKLAIELQLLRTAIKKMTDEGIKIDVNEDPGEGDVNVRLARAFGTL